LPPDDRLYNPLLTIDPALFGLRPLYLGVLFGAFGIETRSAALTWHRRISAQSGTWRP
jgi:hypothetical protein